MNLYRYQLKRSNGQVMVGTLKAASLPLATQQARLMGGSILELVRANDDAPRQGLLGWGQGVSSKDLLTFTSQLAVMSKAGIGLTAALAGIGEQTQAPRMAHVIRTLKRDVEAGRQFSEALQRFPKVFSPLYVNMVRASELSGSFGHMLNRIGDYLNQQLETRRQVVGAMVYPAVIVTLATITTIFMLTFVLPKFMVIFQGKEDILPLPTRMLMAWSHSMVTYWYLYIVVVTGAVGGFLYFIRTEGG